MGILQGLASPGIPRRKIMNIEREKAARAEIRKIPTWRLQQAYKALLKGEPTSIEIVEQDRSFALNIIGEVLWERGKSGGISEPSNPPQRVVPIAPAKIQQMRLAAREQLSPAEYEEFERLASQLMIYGLTPWINAELGRLMAKVRWELEIEESPEWAEALQACDRAFLGNELKAMCYEYGMSPHGHKKELCRKLYNHKVEEVVEVMGPYFKGIE